MLTLITFLIVLSILVFAHEVGHFWMAKKFGVKAEEFGLGFPPRIFGVYRNNIGKWKKVIGNKKVGDAPGTVYSINWFPLGGFVKIKGENGESGEDQDSFVNRKIWQRTAMVSAGVSMNVILAAILISVGFMIGLPQVLDGVGSRAKVSDKKIQVAQVLPDSPAANADIMLGDIILDIDGKSFSSYEPLQDYVDENIGQELSYKIKRGEEEITKKAVPIFINESGKGGIGIGIIEVGLVKYPFYLAVWHGIKETIFLVWAIILAFYNLIKGLALGQGVSADIAGPVGIAALTGQFARLGFIYILQFTALLSINLAIINFFPFPALDGGRIIFLIIEKIKGSPVKREVEAIIHNIGFALLMVLILVVTYRDIARFSDKFKILWERIIS